MAEGISGQLYQFPPESYVDPCTICLGEREDRSLPNNCFHEFCFTCLLQWSEVKPVCPLCVQPFSSIIHNIKSDHEYDEQRIEILDPALDFEYRSESDEYVFSPDLSPYNGLSIFDQIYNRSTLHTIFTQQLVTSEQSLENLDSFPSSLQSDLASHDSGSSLSPMPLDRFCYRRIGRVYAARGLLASDEGGVRGLHCEISNGRCLPYLRPLDPTVGRRRTEEEGGNLESEEEEGGNFESDEEQGVNFESEIDRDL